MCTINNNSDVFKGITVDSKVRIHFNCIVSEYRKWSIDKMELAEVLGVTCRQIDYMIQKGASPKYRKLGYGKNSKVVFFAIDVAEYMAEVGNGK